MSLDQPAPIKFLSQEVKNQLRSGVATPSVIQCVEELVVNSIDAGASCIAVRVDLPNCKIQVADNGRGITKDDMSCIGERYATSKCRDTKDLENISHYGYRGEALASIREISSVLEISSRARGSEVTYIKLYRHGKDQGISKDSKVRPSGGTTITAHNVFYNLPVRRKTLCCPMVYEQICKRLQAISLIHPQISLTLRNDSTGVKSIQTHSSSSVVQTFGHLFGRDIADCLKEVNHIRTLFNMSGFIGTTSHRNKSLQFVYVNGRLVLKTKLHKLMNELLGNSLVTKNKGKNRDTIQGYGAKPNPATCQPSPGVSQIEYGIFVVNITCPRNEYDITLDPSKTLVEFRDWEGALTCVQEMVTSFLQTEHLTMKLSPTLSNEAGLQESDSLSNDNLAFKETDVCINAISTTDCTNAVQSTCVRRQTTAVLEPDVSLVMVGDKNPCDVGTVADSNGQGDLVCNDTPSDIPHKSPFACGDTNERMDEPEITESNSTEIPISQCGLNVQADKEKSLPTCPSNHTDPVVGSHCEPCGKILATSPVRITPDNKQVDVSPLKVKSDIADVLSSDEGEDRTNNEALLLSSSSELDMCSSEETLSSSEVEMGTPKSDVHQCCDDRCMSFRKDVADSGQEVIDLVSPRTKLAVKARNSLSMFRRSIKKKKLAKALKDDSSKKTGQKVKTHLQFVTVGEHKTIALRWHRSPGFRSRLESLNIKCQERQGQMENPIMGVLHHKLSSRSEPNQACNDTSAHITKGNSRKEVCQSFQQGSSDENTALDCYQRDLHVTRKLENTGADQHVNDKHNISSVGTVQQESNPAEGKEPPVKHSKGQITSDTSRREITEVTPAEHCVIGREKMEANVPNVHRNLVTESTDTKKRAADHLNCPISHKEQKNEVHHTRTIDSSNLASTEMPRKFLTSTSFMISACEVFSDREQLQTSTHIGGCTEIKRIELEQPSNHASREVDEVRSLSNKEKSGALLPFDETEPFSVHMEDDIADGAGILCRNVNQDQALDQSTSCPVMNGDTTRIEASGIQQMDEIDTTVDDEQSTMKILKSVPNLEESKESDVELIIGPGTIHEDMDRLDASDADDSISLLYVPHQDEESLCTETKPHQELIALAEPANEERNASIDIQFTETSTAMVPSLSPTIAHQNSDQLDVTADLAIASELSSAIQGEDINTLCVSADEVRVSSHDNQSAQSTRASEIFRTTQSEKIDAKKSSSAGSTDAEFVVESREWYSVYDASRGMKVFINRFNGNCSVDKPVEGQMLNQHPGQNSEDPQFSMVTKSDTLAHPHLPHSAASFVTSLRDRRESSSHPSDPPVTPGTMATLDAAMEESQGEDDELANVKWGNSSRIAGKGDATDEGQQSSRYDSAEMGCGFITSTILEGSSSVDAKFQAKVLSSLNPCQFTKGMFNNIKVLGQVDNKFIACLMNNDHDKNPAGEPNLLVLVDQHAAHERIRLEMLTQDAYTRHDVDADTTRSIRTSDITPALPVSLSQPELRLMKAYSHKLKNIGIEYTLSTDTVMVTHLPACVVEREANELKRGRQTIATSIAETLIKEVLDSLQHQSGAVSSLPKTITRILNSQACHGAIKFGDTLDINECKTLIGQLSSCDLPFQCAHGRPALMPILDFRKIKLGNSEKVTPSPPQLWKLKYLSSGKQVQD